MISSISTNTITLRSAGADIVALAEKLGNDFSKEQIKNILMTFEDTVFNSYNVVSSTTIFNHYIPELVRRYTGTKKAEFASALAALLGSPDFIAAFFKVIPDRALDIYRGVYENIFFGYGRIKEIYGKDVVTFKRNRSLYYYNNNTGEVDPLFTLLRYQLYTTWDYGSYFLFMPPSIRQAMTPFFSPQLLPVGVTQEYPLTDGKKVYNNCAYMEPIYPVLHTLYLNGILEMGKTRVTATTLKRVARQVSVPEFFPDDPDKVYKILAGTLATSVFCLNAENSLARRRNIPLPSHEVAREIVKFMRSYSEKILYFLAALIIDKPYQTVFNAVNFSIFIRNYFNILATHAADGWLASGGIENALRNSSDFPQDLTLISPEHLCNYSATQVNDFTGVTITPTNMIREFATPMIQYLTATLAALGIVEIVYGMPSRNATSPLEGIRAIRLTRLGCFALGVTDEFTSCIAESGPQFEFDTERLIMRTLGENNPYEGILKDYLIPVGDHRFTASPEKFIENCNNEKDLLNKIANFRTLTGKDLPEIWDSFFTGILNKSKAVTPIKERLVALQVSPDDRRLVDIISGDTQLRAYTICAEGYRLFIPAEKFPDFQARMRTYGYIV